MTHGLTRVQPYFWELDDEYQQKFYQEVLPPIQIIVEDTTESPSETKPPVDLLPEAEPQTSVLPEAQPQTSVLLDA